MASKTGYMSFMPEAPMVGLDPHPGFAPADTIESFDAAGYFKALGAYEDRAELEDEVTKDHQARLEAVEDGDLEDCEEEADSVYEVTVHDDGRIEVIHDEPRYVFADYTIAQVYQAYGMVMPDKPSTPSNS